MARAIEKSYKTEWELISDKGDSVIDYKSEFGDFIGYDTRTNRVELSIVKDGLLQKGIPYNSRKDAFMYVDSLLESRK